MGRPSDPAVNTISVSEADTLLPTDATHDPEAAPLLVSSSPSPRKTTPLPLAQLLILAFVRLAEPIAYTQVRMFLLANIQSYY